MKKLTFSLLLTAFLSLSILAENVPSNVAKTVAKNVYYMYTGIKQADIILSEPFVISNENTPLYYVFDIENFKGFVIIAADDRVIPVLGFSDEVNYSEENQAAQFIVWMQGYANQIQYAIDNDLQSTFEIDAKWQQYNSLPEDFTFEKSGKDVSPLLATIAWNQSAGWNNECPVDAGGPGGHVYAGCVATAAGQVMMYWQYPNQGTGSHTYYHPDYGTLSANFGATTYNWAGMSPTTYSGDCPLLLFHLGVAFEMDYGPTGSGAYSSDITTVFPTYFGYKSSLEWVTKSAYSTTAWQNLLIAELEAGRPMTYRGNNSSGSGGHSFVMDGCQGSDYFHFNWGWSGSSNGYFYLTNLNPGYDFTYDQAGCRGIEPIGTQTYNPPINLQASVTDNDVTLTWEAPLGFGNPSWQAYAEIGDLTNLNWPVPERAVLFDDADFSFTYPAEITKISHVFYEHPDYLWPDATFHFKIYSSNGSSLLYESGDIEAVHLQVLEHTLTSPIEVIGDFYVAVVPVDASGHPSSGSQSPPVGISHSYNGSAGSWSFYPDYEYITGVYIAGETEKYTYAGDAEDIINKKIDEIDYSKVAPISENDLIAVKNKSSKALTGYKVFRDGSDISGTLSSGTLTYDDEDLSNGNYTYCIKAVYDTGISGCSNEEDVTIDYVLEPPTNLQASLNENDVSLIWEIPDNKNSKALTGYIVFRDGNNISGTLSSGTLTYYDEDLTNGAYSYCVKAVYDNGTSECSDGVYVVVNYVSINEINKIVNIYPNPTNGELNINFGQTQQYIIEINDIIGNNIFYDFGTCSFLNYNVSLFSKGIYILNIKLTDKIITEKIIIK